MSDSSVETLILDLLKWISREERTYEEVIDVWRTSCPRFPIWVEASDRGLVATML
jgi:D-3-phosphoglycerate dehydrogenase